MVWRTNAWLLIVIYYLSTRAIFAFNQFMTTAVRMDSER
ncbi:hypothetical protein AT5A_13492 [Agrobacterium tumefaciens 5A]|nr:hypothetical protein AT5A_13492 [Agrobacterium tumefaciens 5A]